MAEREKNMYFSIRRNKKKWISFDSNKKSAKQT